jgi:hypothetical protein
LLTDAPRDAQETGVKAKWRRPVRLDTPTAQARAVPDSF